MVERRRRRRRGRRTRARRRRRRGNRRRRLPRDRPRRRSLRRRRRVDEIHALRRRDLRRTPHRLRRSRHTRVLERAPARVGAARGRPRRQALRVGFFRPLRRGVWKRRDKLSKTRGGDARPDQRAGPRVRQGWAGDRDPSRSPAPSLPGRAPKAARSGCALWRRGGEVDDRGELGRRGDARRRLRGRRDRVRAAGRRRVHRAGVQGDVEARRAGRGPIGI
mmetsp:Transcript_10969/g.42723  ORF Transcript_10969/g.42723 Transcript_10969/m.42723 type:complete len:220 (-) Transcript_10969:1836-2495(-)